MTDYRSMTKPKIGLLEIAKDYRPDWMISDIPAQIPLPKINWQPLPGKLIASASLGNLQIPLITEVAGEYFSQYDWQSWFHWILAEDYRQISRPLYTKFPFHYHSIPTHLRMIIYRLLVRFYKYPKPKGFPSFPIEQGLEVLSSIYDNIAGKPQYSSSRTKIILTHDIDTKAGFQWVKDIASLEIKYGFSSIWFVVAHAFADYRVNYSILDWLASHGFEIGLHGYNHDNKLIFLPPEQMLRRFERCLPLIKRYQMQSFRSPSWFRNRQLFQVLNQYLPYDYSYLDADVACPGGFGGCLWTKPFQRDGLTHIPTTILYEAPLFMPELGGLDATPEKIFQFWQPKLQWLQSCGGNIVVITHPDPAYSGNPKMLAAYELLLSYLQQAQSACS